jgi:hypothetical protein
METVRNCSQCDKTFRRKPHAARQGYAGSIPATSTNGLSDPPTVCPERPAGLVIPAHHTNT